MLKHLSSLKYIYKKKNTQKKQTQINPGVCVPVSLLSLWSISDRYGKLDPKKPHSRVGH